MGHLMLDEIKLKNSIAYNCNSNKVTGFSTRTHEHINESEYSRYVKEEEGFFKETTNQSIC